MKRCIYCGSPATTSEHCPPKILFLNSDRPSGWKFDACSGCNNRTSDSDQIFALFVYSAILDQTKQEARHFEKVAKGVHNNQPWVIDELLNNLSPLMLGSVLQKTTAEVHVASMGQSLQSHLDRIADKLTLSAFFIEHGSKAPPNALVAHHWFTNWDFSVRSLSNIPRIDGPLKYLRQGKKSSRGQFAYKSVSYPNGHGLFHFVFHKRILLCSFLTTPAATEDVATGFRLPMTKYPERPSSLSFAPLNPLILPHRAFLRP